VSAIARDFSVYVLDPDILERDFTDHVRRLAIEGGWLFYHTHDSRHSSAGFYDCVMIRGGVEIHAELKKKGGKTTTEQDKWISAGRMVARGSSGALEVYVWWPADFEQIARRLLRDVPL
jgi:hypothetical protein